MPRLAGTAYQGLIGRVVELIAPHTEADPAGLLVNLLAVLGNIIGRGPHVPVGAEAHCPKIFVLTVGDTAKARKGTAFAEARRFGLLVDSAWEDRIVSGVGSGEGLIAAISTSIGPNGASQTSDARLLVVEEEFARLLATAKREGNTTSAVVRSCWDDRPLGITNRGNPLKVSEHHVSFIAQITTDELRLRLDAVEVMSGLINRFLFARVARSKLLPEGGALDDEALASIAAEVSSNIQRGRTLGVVTRTCAAERVWKELYSVCAEDDPGGLLGAATARAEPQILRLALLYALVDGAAQIDTEHLLAAFEVWRFSRCSAWYVFGDRLGDPVAEAILEMLDTSNSPVTRTSIHSRSSRHWSKAQIDQAVTRLVDAGRVEEVSIPTAGRPAKALRSVAKEAM